ncbi:hypothetical protein AM2_037 [Lactococcus phage AM2]|uniref:Uncharacterized protein n=7 Tax=Audreyjarvisvirus AM1 TaxID=2845188 RepID=A0A1W6JLI3_9CAUD|nr:hypothetical protein H1Z30_gp037 [Lactococcus phage AM1]ARM66342.1 hypothetical protein AM2_037 [Lactococcus phage AM2]ARM66519.1 hypothetical protein AM3_037 [Lactococcus phage AM3]ARM67072.1 hypothetical protein AM8_037 [Lactococcus phage AM8]ARM67250.1 hypothetical protein AM9_037 [Lactococcus phage AM9]ARM67429.1 hypothetical protein AM11_037 [Lactococcus phage AM11]ARQ95617.1 hypothetical protein AM12_038 [Lactococcus phage AM12]
MKKTTKKIILTLAILAIGFGLGWVPKGQTVKEKAFSNEITSLRHESERIAKLDHYTELPGIYQKKQIKKLDKFIKENKNLTANELYTVKGLTYDNSDAYQEFYLTEH